MVERRQASKWQLREALSTDLEAICEIYNFEVAGGISTMDTEPWIPEQRMRWLVEHQAPAHPLIVGCNSQGRVLGWACLSPWSPKRGYARTAESSLFVHPEVHAKGLGRTLLESLVGFADKAQHRVILARIVDLNSISLGLFASVGFDQVGTMHRVGEKLGTALNVVLLEYLLPQPDT